MPWYVRLRSWAWPVLHPVTVWQARVYRARVYRARTAWLADGGMDRARASEPRPYVPKGCWYTTLDGRKVYEPFDKGA